MGKGANAFRIDITQISLYEVAVLVILNALAPFPQKVDILDFQISDSQKAKKKVI